jgi:tetratricopeptide (TPR) repeat protein
MWTNRRGLKSRIFPHGQLFTWTIRACIKAYMEADGSETLPFAMRRLFGIEFDWSPPTLLPPSRIVLLSKGPLPDPHALDDERFGGEATRFLTSRLLSVLQNEKDEELQSLLKALEEGDRRRLERLLDDTILRERSFLGFKERVREFVGKDRREDKHGFGNHLMGFAESITRIKTPVIDLAEACFAKHPEGVCSCLAYYLQRRPDHGEAWNDLGIFLMEKGEFEEAKRALVNACVLDYALAYRNLAFLYLTQDDLESARKVEQEAARKNLDEQLLRGLITADESTSAEAHEAIFPP